MTKSVTWHRLISFDNDCDVEHLMWGDNQCRVTKPIPGGFDGQLCCVLKRNHFGQHEDHRGKKWSEIEHDRLV